MSVTEIGKYVGKDAVDKIYSKVFGQEVQKDLREADEITSTNHDYDQTRTGLWFQIEKLIHLIRYDDPNLTDADIGRILSPPVITALESLATRIRLKKPELFSGGSLRADLTTFHTTISQDYTLVYQEKEKIRLEQERIRLEQERIRLEEKQERIRLEEKQERMRERIQWMAFVGVIASFIGWVVVSKF
jgi:hypothetical protein